MVDKSITYPSLHHHNNEDVLSTFYLHFQHRMARQQSSVVNTIIIGGGPSSLLLSYILHGYIPCYASRHPDDLLDSRLRRRRHVLNLDPAVYSHLQDSIRYSSQALPINTLLDTLVRPNADTEINPASCLDWKVDSKAAVSHVVLTNAPRAGGQWAENAVSANDTIGTLSYAEMLSLPGYSFSEHHQFIHGSRMPDLQRPSRAEVASYYARYPEAAGISSTLRTSTTVTNVSRTHDGLFHVSPVNMFCKNLVLASGIFTSTMPPPPLLLPLQSLRRQDLPLLVIGSGFSAADAIISAPPERKIIHIYKWEPGANPSPLRACHHQAYPDYAGIYRQMKAAGIKSMQNGGHMVAAPTSPALTKRGNPFFKGRNWASVYEGLPNAEILNVVVDQNTQTAIVEIQPENGCIIERVAGGLEFLIGRRGSLAYLDSALRGEVLSGISESSSYGLISSTSLRAKAEMDLEMSSNVFIIGSLTGDSLVRHAFGSCVSVAGKIRGAWEEEEEDDNDHEIGRTEGGYGPNPSDVKLHRDAFQNLTNGAAHADLHVDRRELVSRPE